VITKNEDKTDYGTFSNMLQMFLAYQSVKLWH